MIDIIFLNVLGQIEKYPFGFWNDYAHREFAASHCQSKQEYKSRFPTSYLHSLKDQDELDDFIIRFFEDKTLIKRNRKPHNYWDVLRNREIAASECHSISEFIGKYSAAYSKCSKDELNDYSEQFFDKKSTKPANYWKDYKRREEAASECHSISEFAKKYYSAYIKCSKEELNDYSERFFDKKTAKPANYWKDYKRREEAASKCHSKTEFMKKYYRAYSNSTKEELNDYSERFFDKKTTKPCGYWNIQENREKAASECHSRSEFLKKYGGAYDRCSKEELDDYALRFFDEFIKRRVGYWSIYENRLNAAKQCKTQAEYKEKFRSSYDKSRKIPGEIQYFRDNVFEYNPTPKNYWKDYKRREEAASKCRSKSEYAKKYPVACRYSRKNMDEFNDFTNRFFTNTFVDDESEIYIIYVYLDERLKIAYCGLTRQTIGMRDCQHRRKLDRLYQLFVNEYHTNIPKPIVIKENLNRIEAQEAEDYYINFYKEQGYTMLNSGHTGANIGSIGYIFKYNKERCLECAKKCITVKQFRKEYNKEYMSAKHNGWLDEYDWLEPDKFKKDISYEECAELAKTCKSISEFEKKFPSEVIIARKNKWLYDFFGEPVRWPYDACEKESKKYTTRSDFRKFSPVAYTISLRNHWIDDFTWLSYQVQHSRTFETLFEDVLKYTSKTEIFKCDYSLHNALYKRNLFDCFFDEKGKVKESIKELKVNSEEYEILKNEVNEKINIFLSKEKERNKNRKRIYRYTNPKEI